MNNTSRLVGVNFLNAKTFDKDYYLNLLQAQAQSQELETETKELLNTIIKSLHDGEYVLNSQEMKFIENYPEKIVDYVIYRYKFRIYPEKAILTDFPVYLLIEPTSICNLRCKMCFQADKFFSEKENMGFIDLDFYKRLIDQAVDGGAKALTMASRGEPLLNKNFAQMLDYAGGKFFELKVNTNCMLMDEKMSHKLLENDITDLVFSIDSSDKDQYESIRVGAKFDTVLENIKKFNEIRAKYYPDSKVVTRISGVKATDDQDLDKFVNFWSKYVDEVAYVNCIDRKDSYNNSATKANYPCKTLWNRMYVWWNGICNPCDFDYKSNLNLGNAKEKSLKEIWNSQEMQELRANHLKGNRADHHPCDVCVL